MEGWRNSDVWCRSCGSALTDPSPACPVCRTPLVRPHPDNGRIGTVAIVGRALFKKPAIVIAETVDTVSVVAKDEEVTSLPPAEFDALTKVEVPGQQVHSAAGRLWRALIATANNTYRGNWSVALVDRVAWEVGRHDLGAVRATTLDRLALGLECESSYLPLSATEIDWYRAHSAAAAGADETMLRYLISLPAGRYPRRLELILLRAGALLANPELWPGVVEALKPIADIEPLASTVSTAFLNGDPLTPPAALRRLADEAAARSRLSAQPFLDLATAVSTFSRIPQLPQSPSPYLLTMDAYLAGKAGADLDDALPTVANLPLELVDELIDSGSITRLKEGVRPWHGETMSYFECRIQPEKASEEVLAEVGFNAELARRALLRSDRAAILTLEPDEDVRHYLALMDLKDDPGGGPIPEGLRPSVIELVSRTRAIGAQGLAAPTTVPEEIIADSTLWPLLRKAAERGNLRPASHRHALAEPFEVWAELCGLQRKLFDGAWNEVVTGGSELARRTKHEAFADEAQNMAAYACLQLGRPDDALKLLEEALAGEFTVGLVVNAAIVASSRGVLSALPYLSRVVSLGQTREVKQAAVRRAVQLWLDDPTLLEYPEPLARIVRQALRDENDDEFHLELVRLSAYNDVDWMATSSLPAVNESQRAMNRYFQARSRVSSSTTPDIYANLCKVLVDLVRRPPLQPWVEREWQKNIDMVLDGVHCDFGDALGLALGIDEFVKAGVLDLYQTLILAPQACAHMAMALGSDDNELSEQVEQRLLLESVRVYRQRSSELTSAQDEVVREDMARCVAATTACFIDAAARERDQFADAYNELTQRMRWDTQNFHALRNRKRTVLNEFDPYLVRGRALIAAMDVFPLNEARRKLRNDVSRQLQAWSQESDDLRRSL